VGISGKKGKVIGSGGVLTILTKSPPI